MSLVCLHILHITIWKCGWICRLRYLFKVSVRLCWCILYIYTVKYNLAVAVVVSMKRSLPRWAEIFIVRAEILIRNITERSLPMKRSRECDPGTRSPGSEHRVFVMETKRMSVSAEKERAGIGWTAGSYGRGRIFHTCWSAARRNTRASECWLATCIQCV